MAQRGREIVERLNQRPPTATVGLPCPTCGVVKEANEFSNFLSLSPEVRHLVYKHCIDDAHITYDHKSFSQKMLEKSNHFTILLVCKQITAEVRPLIYASMYFYMPQRGGSIFSNFDQHLPAIVRSRLRDIRVESSYVQQLTACSPASLPQLQRIMIMGTERLQLPASKAAIMDLNSQKELERAVKDRIKIQILDNKDHPRYCMNELLRRGTVVEGVVNMESYEEGKRFFVGAQCATAT